MSKARPPARRNTGRYPRSSDRIPTRITSSAAGDGWVTIRIERSRTRTFRISTDEIPLLLAELGKHHHPVTVSYLPGRGPDVAEH